MTDMVRPLNGAPSINKNIIINENRKVLFS